VVHIDGGPGNDTLTILRNAQAVQIFVGSTEICGPGVAGGTVITVVSVEHITLIGEQGFVCQWDAP
jgi:hypothetical protein